MRIRMWSFFKSVPNVPPIAWMFSKENHSSHNAILFRMKAIFSLAQAAERCPFYSTASLWVLHRIVQPEKETANFVWIQEGIKEWRTQWSFFLQSSNRFIGQLEQRSLQCLFRATICT